MVNVPIQTVHMRTEKFTINNYLMLVLGPIDTVFDCLDANLGRFTDLYDPLAS
jgi:hypothetical protein